VDFRLSSRLAINILIELNNKGLKPLATFDFLNKTIEPTDADTRESRQLLKDYLDWLPEHFKNHDCDVNGLEKLHLTIA
jgi:hypothetical protein